MATYSDVLRGRNQARGLRARGERYRSMADQPTSFVTQPGAVQQMGGMTAPTPQGVDWGNILQKGFGSYMAADTEKKADAAEMQAEELNAQFMQDAIGQDPEAQRLLQMVQAGVPGAEQALSDKVAPKRQPLATFTQFVAQNPELDDESAVAMGAQVGIGPELSLGIVRAAKAGTLRMEKLGLAKEEREFGRTLLRDENLAALKGVGKSGPAAGLSPGERQLRGKMMNEADKELMDLSQAGGKFEEMMTTIERDDSFGSESKVATFLSEQPSSVLSAIGRSQLSEGSLMLKEYMNSKVLTRMKALGGNDSNEELRTITASLPDAFNNKEAAIAMLRNLHEWEETNRLAIKLRRDDIQSGEWFGKEPSRDDYYQRAKQMRAGGMRGNPQPAAPTVPFRGVPAEQMQGLEGLLDELGLQ